MPNVSDPVRVVGESGYELDPNADGSMTVEFASGNGMPITFSDDLSLGPFNRLRVTNGANRFDVEFIYDKQPFLVDDISSGVGTAVHQANTRDVLLSVGGAAVGVDQGCMRGHYWVPYTPGNGQVIDITGVLDFANLGGTCEVFLRSTVSGSTTLQTIPQASWLAATTGIDWQYSQIFAMDFQSLKIGRIRFGLVRGGISTQIAEITNDNLRNSGYWQYPSLPPYWKIYNEATETVAEIGYGDEFNGIGFRFKFGSLQATATMTAVCATVKSEDGVRLFDLPGFPRATGRGVASLTVSNVLIPLMSIRNAATFQGFVNNALTIPTSVSLYTDEPIYYAVYYRPQLTNPSWVAVDANNSHMEYDISATAVANGIDVEEDYLAATFRGTSVSTSLLGRTLMSLGSTGTSDVLTVAAIRSTGADAEVLATMKWKEIR